MSKSTSSALRSRLWRELSQYLLEHPDAQDTLEGIAQWWLLEQCIQQTTADLKAAVEELSRAGFIQTRSQRDGRVSYGLNHARRAELLVLVRRGRKRGEAGVSRRTAPGGKQNGTEQ